MGHEVRSSIMVRGELEPLEFRFDIQKFQAHKSLDEKKKSSLFIFLFITRVSNDFKVSSLLFLFLENSFILISMSHLRSMIISEESWKIFTSFLPALDSERIVSKSNRFEKYLKVGRLQAVETTFHGTIA